MRDGGESKKDDGKFLRSTIGAAQIDKTNEKEVITQGFKHRSLLMEECRECDF